MLAILSDLHFCDGTATERNVSPKAFALALKEIYELALEVAKRRDRPTKLDLILLGDVVDLLRTERWFEVPLADRPWGTARALECVPASPATITRAGAILDEILAENADALRSLRGEEPKPPVGVEVRRIYFPGNHDRLYLHDEALAARIRAALGAVDVKSLAGEGIHRHRLEMPAYGLLARHGHEWDEWNFESFREEARPSDYRDEHYLATPIGDPITTELAARLPYEIRRRLAESKALSEPERLNVYRRMQRIEDVRPLLASFEWAYYEADAIGGSLTGAQADEVRRVVDACVKDVTQRFRALDYYRAWNEKHGRLLRLDSANLLKAALKGLSMVKAGTVLDVAGYFEAALQRSEPTDTCRLGASREDLRTVGAKGLRFVVYGHTHEPLQVALKASYGAQDLYLNSGTFRQGVFRTEDKAGFIGWERLSYLALFSEEEAYEGAPRVGPSFVAWTGHRQK